jgi:hypothetical protein
MGLRQKISWPPFNSDMTLSRFPGPFIGGKNGIQRRDLRFLFQKLKKLCGGIE